MFGRKVRKYNSVLAGQASAAFSMQLGHMAVFDCRMVPIPSLERVQDYFLWRQEDAHRNALNAHCYWMLRKAFLSKKLPRLWKANRWLLKTNSFFQGESTLTNCPIGRRWESVLHGKILM